MDQQKEIQEVYKMSSERMKTEEFWNPEHIVEKFWNGLKTALFTQENAWSAELLNFLLIWHAIAVVIMRQSGQH